MDDLLVHFFGGNPNTTDHNFTTMNAIFLPPVGLIQARLDCDVDDFDWQQIVTHEDDPTNLFAVNFIGDLCASLSPSIQLLTRCSTKGGSFLLSSGTTPFSDPPQDGGYTYEETLDFSYPFYYDAKNDNDNPLRNLNRHENFSLITSFSFLTFFDQPKNRCLQGVYASQHPSCAGTESTNYKGFKTKLVGVKNGTIKDLGQNFREWTSNYSGNNTGGIPSEVTDVLETPINGSGGVTITSVNGMSVGSLPSGGSCDGVFDGIVNGSVTVSANQNCTLTNNCEITGNVTVNGGSLDLGCVVDGSLTANGGNLFLGAAHVKGNFRTSQASALSITGAAIDGSLSIQSLSGSAQNMVCATQVKGNLLAQANASPIEIGGASSSGCTGNTISGNLTVSNNTAALQVDSNTVGGNVTVDNDSATTDVSGNSVGGNLECQNDNTVTHVALNVVKGHNQGQCAAFP
jgi:hypothetical protein